MRALLVSSVMLLAGFGAADAAQQPIAVAVTGGTGIATVSGTAGNRWLIVVTTQPRGLRVLVKVAGRPDRIGKSPIRLGYACANCGARARARLLPSAGKPLPSTATMTLLLYRG